MARAEGHSDCWWAATAKGPGPGHDAGGWAAAKVSEHVSSELFVRANSASTRATMPSAHAHTARSVSTRHFTLTLSQSVDSDKHKPSHSREARDSKHA